MVQGAASGGVASSGTFGQLGMETAKMGELDAQAMRNNALKQAWGYQTAASSDEYAGNLGARGGWFNAMGGLLTGGVRSYQAYRMAGGN